MEISVIVPVYNGGPEIHECLRALSCSTRPPREVIVVDDGSSDGQAQLASAAAACTYLLLEDGPHGPSVARNHGAARASENTDILVFIDADVAVRESTLKEIEAVFLQQEDVSALFGSYDSEPSASGTVSQYRNLLHHHVHQTANTHARTFWAGCGAVRYEPFHTLQGFSAIYATPSIEDVEFGIRLHNAGYSIRLHPEIQVKHLKRWTLRSMLRTDVFARAVPWTRLMQSEPALATALNLSLRHRLAALLSLLFVTSLIASLFNALMILPVGLFLLLFVLTERALLKLFLRKLGFLFTVKGCFLQMFYYSYATTAYIATRLVMLLESLAGRRETNRHNLHG